MKGIIRICLAGTLLAASVRAEQRVIIRALGGQLTLSALCAPIGCSLIRSLGDPLSQLFLIGIPDNLNLNSVLSILSALPGILSLEIDQHVGVAQDRPPIPQ